MGSDKICTLVALSRTTEHLHKFRNNQSRAEYGARGRRLGEIAAEIGLAKTTVERIAAETAA